MLRFAGQEYLHTDLDARRFALEHASGEYALTCEKLPKCCTLQSYQYVASRIYVTQQSSHHVLLISDEYYV